MRKIKFVFIVSILIPVIFAGCSSKKSIITDDGIAGDQDIMSEEDALPFNDDDNGKNDTELKDGENGYNDEDETDIYPDTDEDTEYSDEEEPDKEKEESDSDLEPDGMGPGSENAYDPGSDNADGISVDEE